MRKIYFLFAFLILALCVIAKNKAPKGYGVIPKEKTGLSFDVLDRNLGAKNIGDYGTYFPWSTDNPCPKGWRIPSADELTEIMNTLANDDDTVQQGHPGQKVKKVEKDIKYYQAKTNLFTQEPLFMPLAGSGIQSFGDTIFDAGWAGRYWSSTDTPNGPYYLFFGRGLMWVYPAMRGNACQIRCVR